uniref:CLOCK-interacting pacemaker b n=1 Tax=Neogobius melanostomus TaxID=47308 RepID=A0A8C6SHT3_9GOBI
MLMIFSCLSLFPAWDTPPDLKPWRFSPSVEVGQAVVQQPQVVFLQPVMSRRTPSKSKDHTSSSSARHRRSKKYLPILKSYPKIAPRDGGSSSGRGTGSSSSSSSSTSSEWSSQRDHSQKVQKRHHNGVGIASPALPLSTVSPLLQTQLSQLPSTEATNFGLARDSQLASPRLPELPAPSPVCFELKKEALSDPETLSAEQPDGENDGETRRKRFCNTYNILRKSGLLDITLRTKELLWQNKRTQSDLERLKEQTDLFLQALRSRDASICVKLQASLREEEEEKESVEEVPVSMTLQKAVNR